MIELTGIKIKTEWLLIILRPLFLLWETQYIQVSFMREELKYI